jgi:molybdopterin-containing oxidoreductase family iron-sulfur binding subunit
MDDSRRRFLKQLGCTTVGAGIGLPILGSVLPARGRTAARAAAPARQWALVIDVEKCLREDVRRACFDACSREHNVPRIPDPDEQVRWVWDEAYERVFPDQVHARTSGAVREAPVLVLCNHCTEPPCVKVCPTEATWKRETDGIVMMDMHRCIGCRYCMAACPYGARSFNWRDPAAFIAHDERGNLLSEYPARTVGVVEKCTFCAERIRNGRAPACVEAANGVPGGEGALVFGDVSDPGSDVSRVLRERNTIVRRESLGTGPNVFYIVADALPAVAGGEGA